VGNALKWFPDRRGLAAGLTAMGFGAGSALTVVPIAAMIKSSGYEATFLDFGLAQGAVVLASGWMLRGSRRARQPRTLPAPAAPPRAISRRSRWCAHESSWIMYAMFVLMAAGDLMATAQLAPIARDLQIADVPVSLLGLTLPALTFALSIDRVLNGVTRPFFGWVSDPIGYTMREFPSACDR
jgi:OFA family oxalate/formate antiporter-like MFS transporter